MLTAFSGREALERLDSKEGDRVDLVVLDVKMPGMNGLEALVEIKRRHPLIEVIMLTGHGHGGIRHRGNETWRLRLSDETLRNGSAERQDRGRQSQKTRP